MYGEDVDLSWRLRGRGFRLRYLPRLAVVHRTYAVAAEVKPLQVLGGVQSNLCLRARFGGCYVANEGFDLASGNAVLAADEADAVAYGRLFIANPDLPARFASGSALNPPNPATFYADGAAGYTDYPALPG